MDCCLYEDPTYRFTLISLEFPEKNFELSLEREHCEYRVHSREISMEVCKLHVVWANKKQLM